MLFSWLPGLRERHLEEVGIDEHRRRRHEAAARVAPDADAVDVDVGMAPRQLFDCRLLVGEAVVAQVAIAVVVVPLRARRVPAAIAHLDHHEAELRQRDVVVARVERLGHALGLRPGIDVGDDRILLLLVEVEGLVHHPVEVGHAIVGLDREGLGELEAHVLERAQIRRLELGDDVAERVIEDGLGRAVDA